MKITRHSLSILLAAGLVLGSSGCSLFGSGKKKEGNKYGDEPTLSEAELDAQRESRFGSGNIPEAEGEGVFRDIHFAYDSSSISEEARQDIEANAQVLLNQANIRVQLEGHTDERGTEEYNLALGQARARAVRDVLASAGIPASRLEIISYGENVPLNDGHDEAAYGQNRRVHFSAMGSGGAAGVTTGTSTGTTGGGFSGGSRY